MYAQLAKRVDEQVFGGFVRAVRDLEEDQYHSQTSSPTGDPFDRVAVFEGAGLISYYVRDQAKVVHIFEIRWRD